MTIIALGALATTICISAAFAGPRSDALAPSADQTWLIQMVCYPAPNATSSCEEYPGKTHTFTSDADMHSQSDCRIIATGMARKYHYMSGNDYAFRCIASDYQPKELPTTPKDTK